MASHVGKLEGQSSQGSAGAHAATDATVIRDAGHGMAGSTTLAGSRPGLVDPQASDNFAETDQLIDIANNTRDDKSTTASGHQDEPHMSQAASVPSASSIATSVTRPTMVVDAATFPKCRYCFKYKRVCDGGRPCGTCVKMRRRCYQVPQELLDERPELARSELLKAEQQSAFTGNGTNDAGAPTKISAVSTKRSSTTRSATMSSATMSSSTKRAAAPTPHAMESPKKKRKIGESVLALNLARCVARKVQKKLDATSTTDPLPVLAVFRRKQAAELKHCYRAINELLSDKHGGCSTYFLDPVDHVAKNLPHYHSTVEHPMDLSTMKASLEDGHYRIAREFKKDFVKIVAAAKLFNMEGSDVFEAAIKLEEVFWVVWAETKHPKEVSENEQSVPENEQSPTEG
ncbi:transcription initiation at TATA-containing promoter protein [Diaporthe australafricana]|uniref:Transcription initiation at TATA-containing promoter protein n=1 Tax=Diaporthe australafricana TaxID=127596 RepID=A0ABR3X475_9PEZI